MLMLVLVVIKIFIIIITMSSYTSLQHNTERCIHEIVWMMMSRKGDTQSFYNGGALDDRRHATRA